jgi:hypothetical protein
LPRAWKQAAQAIEKGEDRRLRRIDVIWPSGEGDKQTQEVVKRSQMIHEKPQPWPPMHEQQQQLAGG